MKHAKHYRDAVVPAMAALRETGDALEGLVPHGVWPLPDVSGDAFHQVRTRDWGLGTEIEKLGDWAGLGTPNPGR